MACSPTCSCSPVGALTQFSLFALGIMPYITASIIMQVLQVVIPKLQEWQEQGAVGQRKITQWTRYVTIGISVLQATGFTFLFANGGGGLTGGSNISLVSVWSPLRVMLIVTTLTAGSALLMWMGELITNRGVGNGMSLIIFASVVSGMPAAFSAIYGSENGTAKLVVFIAMFVAMIGFIVFVEQGQRRIPVQFAKRVVGRKQYAGQSTYIPLKVNQAGVIPIIFAERGVEPSGTHLADPALDGMGRECVELDQRQPRQHDQPDLPDVPRASDRRLRILLHSHHL